MSRKNFGALALAVLLAISPAIASAQTSVIVRKPDNTGPADLASGAKQDTTNGKLDTLHTDNGAGGTGITQPTGGSGVLGWLSGIYQAVTGTLKTSDTGTISNNAPFQGVVAMTVGTTYTVQRSVGAYCTSAGSATLTLADASNLAVPLLVGWNQYPFAVTAVASVAGGATCTFSNLK